MLRDMPRPRRLYHYTDAAGMLGISNSKTLWAGRGFDMNDSEEQKYFYSFLDEEIERMYWGDIDPRKAKGARAELAALKELSERLKSDPELSPTIYTVSLTADPDDLGQWRGYCPRSGGVSLGFKSADLDALCEEQGFVLAKVSYGDYQDAKNLIHSTLLHCSKKIYGAVSGDELSSKDFEEHAEEFATEAFRYLPLLAPILKHPSFRWEDEWRLISGPADSADLIARPTSTGLKLYLPFQLQTESVRVESIDCVIGPNVDPIAMKSATTEVLRRHFPDVEVSRTESPYR